MSRTPSQQQANRAPVIREDRREIRSAPRCFRSHGRDVSSRIARVTAPRNNDIVAIRVEHLAMHPRHPAGRVCAAVDNPLRIVPSKICRIGTNLIRVLIGQSAFSRRTDSRGPTYIVANVNGVASRKVALGSHHHDAAYPWTRPDAYSECDCFGCLNGAIDAVRPGDPIRYIAVRW